MRNVVVVSHKFLTQPDDDLALFLNNKKYGNVLHIRHSFSDADNRCSFYTWHKAGILHKEERTRDYSGWSEPLIYLKEFFFTFKWAMSAGEKWDCYVGMDGLCVFFGNALRLLGKVKKTVFWAIDFVPANRFGGSLKNRIYHFINKQGYKRSDEMWDLSPRMAGAREKFLGVRMGDYKKHKVVPYGVWTERIKKYDYDKCEKNTLVFMGHLLEKQGVQLVIKALPEIVKKIPNFKFKIIGGGKYKDALADLAKSLGVLAHCDFRGKINDIKIVEDEIAKSCAAIAPYIKKLDTWTYYADPGKVKTYLACGVPVLLTGVPWNAKEIEQNSCGKIIAEDEKSIIGGILEVMSSDANQAYRDRAISYSRGFGYNNIFNGLEL